MLFVWGMVSFAVVPATQARVPDKGTRAMA